MSEYIYLPTAQGPMPVAAEIGGRLYAIHTDHLNTPRQLTDESGQPVWQWTVSAFGEVEATTAETGWIRPRNGNAGQRSGTLPVVFNLRFPGQQFDEESGLHYNHHRYYDPYLTVGYTEADPLGLQAGWNRFAYVDGDPLGAVDPKGLWSFSFGGFIGYGFMLTAGRNPNGSGFMTIQIGRGAGGGVSYDPEGKQPGYKDCQGNSWGFGAGGYGQIDFFWGILNASLGVGAGGNLRSDGLSGYLDWPTEGVVIKGGKGIKMHASAGLQFTVFGGGEGDAACSCP